MDSGRISPSVLLSQAAASQQPEKYTLDGSGETIRFHRGRNVNLAIRSGSAATRRERDSSRVHSRTLADYQWEVRAYDGNLCALHKNLLAYMLVIKSGPAVRVCLLEDDLDRTRIGARMLIKDFATPIVDLAWAVHAPLLAVVDSRANVYVYRVDVPLNISKYATVMNTIDGIHGAVQLTKTPRIAWCPYVPESDDDAVDVNMLALVTGKLIRLFMLNVINASLGSATDVKLEQISTLKGACVQVELSADVTTVCLSPDATALAAAQSDGQVFFFSLDGTEEGVEAIRFAHTWRPDSMHPVNHLSFLDALLKDKEDQFWKYTVTSSHGGCHLSLWECESWQCLSRLRFETPDDDGTPLAMTIDPSNRFIFVSDIDRSNVYCVELAIMGNQPRFISCTQISLCQPLLHLVPFELPVKEKPSTIDSIMDDEVTSPSVQVSLIAINQRSLLQLDINLDAVDNSAVFSSDDEDPGTPIAGDKETSSMMMQTEVFHDNTRRKSADSEEVRGILKSRADDEALMEAVQQLNMKMDDLYNRNERHYIEMEQQHSDEMQKMSNLCNDLAEQMRRRDESLLRAMRTEMTKMEEKLLVAVSSKMVEGIGNIRDTINATTTRSTEELEQRFSMALRESLHSSVVPALERICETLFNQLNGSFHRGLSEYLEQLKTLQTQAAQRQQAAVDQPRALEQLIDSGQVAMAFDTALSRQDLAALMFVCSKVDPDALFNAQPCPLSQPVILALLQQLATKLDSNTELRFRYMEHGLIALNAADPLIAGHLPVVLNQLKESISKFMASEQPNSRFIRQCKTFLMLIKGLGTR